jgi:alpha-beta hydrolase superfamily lysophospholipase
MLRSIRRVLICVAATALAGYAAGGVLLWHFPDRFVGFPEPETRQTPGMAGLRYVDVWLRVGPQREFVHGWFLPNDRHAPVVLLLHGTGRTIAGMVHVATTIHQAGAAVLMIDYRGLGKSTRRPLTEATMYEDAEAAWHELRWHQPDPALRLVYGHSLGGAIALELAARYPDVNGVVVEAAPTSIAALLRESWVARVYPVDALLAGRFDAAAKIPRLGAPLLVIHGKRDAIVPAAMGVELYLRARAAKRLLLVDGAAHSDAAIVGQADYQAAFERMLPPLREPALAGGTAPADGFAALLQNPRLDSPVPGIEPLGNEASRIAALPVPARMPVRPAAALRSGARGRAALRRHALERPAGVAGDPPRGDPRGADGRPPLQRRDGAARLPDGDRGARHRRPQRARVRRHGQPGARPLPAHVHPRVQRAADARAQAAHRGDRGERDRRARRARPAG